MLPVADHAPPGGATPRDLFNQAYAAFFAKDGLQAKETHGEGLNGGSLDVYDLYHNVQERGGHAQVSAKQGWGEVAKAVLGQERVRGWKSAASTIKRLYSVVLNLASFEAHQLHQRQQQGQQQQEQQPRPPSTLSNSGAVLGGSSSQARQDAKDAPQRGSNGRSSGVSGPGTELQAAGLKCGREQEEGAAKEKEGLQSKEQPQVPTGTAAAASGCAGRSQEDQRQQQQEQGQASSFKSAPHVVPGERVAASATAATTVQQEQQLPLQPQPQQQQQEQQQQQQQQPQKQLKRSLSMPSSSAIAPAGAAKKQRASLGGGGASSGGSGRSVRSGKSEQQVSAGRTPHRKPEPTASAATSPPACGGGDATPGPAAGTAQLAASAAGRASATAATTPVPKPRAAAASGGASDARAAPLMPVALQLLSDVHAAAARLSARLPEANVPRFLVLLAKLHADAPAGGEPLLALDGSCDDALLLLLAFATELCLARSATDPARQAALSLWVAILEEPRTCVARLASLVCAVDDGQLEEAGLTRVMLMQRCALASFVTVVGGPRELPTRVLDTCVSVSALVLQMLLATSSSWKPERLPTALANSVVCSAVHQFMTAALPARPSLPPPTAAAAAAAGRGQAAGEASAGAAAMAGGAAAAAAAGGMASAGQASEPPQSDVPEALVLLVSKCVVQAHHEAATEGGPRDKAMAPAAAAAAKDAWLRVHAVLSARLQACASFCQGRNLAGMEWRMYQAAAKVKALAVKVADLASALGGGGAVPMDAGGRMVLQWTTELRVQGCLQGPSFHSVLLAAYALAVAASCGRDGGGGSAAAAAADLGAAFEMIAQSALLRDRPVERLKSVLTAHSLAPSDSPAPYLLLAAAAAAGSNPASSGRGKYDALLDLCQPELLCHF